MRAQPLLLATLLLATALAGCSTEVPGATSRFTFEAPERGGEWRVRAEGEAGTESALVRLHGSREPQADGTLALTPVLSFQFEEGERAGGYAAYHLAGAPVSGARGASAWEATNLLGATQFEADFVTFRPNPVLDSRLSWLHLGAGLWGRTLARGDAVTIPVTSSGGMPANATLTMQGVADGCARVALDIAGEAEATLTMCDGALPARVEITKPSTGTVTVERLARGDRLPPPPAQVTAQAGAPLARAPADGSDLPLALEDALAALDAHPLTGAWLSSHRGAVAVQGRFESRECGGVVGDACRGDGSPKVHAWTLNWTAPGGAWMSAEVARGGAGLPATVTRVESGAGRAEATVPAQVVPLREAMAVWSAFHPTGFSLRGVAYDLAAPEPTWEMTSEHDPARLSGILGYVGSTFAVGATTGLAIDGWVAVYGEPGSTRR